MHIDRLRKCILTESLFNLMLYKGDSKLEFPIQNLLQHCTNFTKLYR